MTNMQQFDRICGDCATVSIQDITEDDVRSCGRIFGATEDEILQAVDGLHEYQDEDADKEDQKMEKCDRCDATVDGLYYYGPSQFGSDGLCEACMRDRHFDGNGQLVDGEGERVNPLPTIHPVT